jgi:N-acetylglucosaminyl-diphospho-decaprenol L-rhamnosyltransferase
MISVLTLTTQNRAAQLRNLLVGIRQSGVQPGEVVVAVMAGSRPAGLPDLPVPVRVVEVPGALESLPLGAARNAAARKAAGDRLVFLDVDCIPGRDLIGRYGKALETFDGVVMGQVRYLPPGVTHNGWSESELRVRGELHPRQPIPPRTGLREEPDPGQFWSLSFAVRRDTLLDRIGGFDEGYTGYGGEDADFAARTQRAGVPLAWVAGARAYHQYHPICDPPLNHLHDVCRNARRFHARWGRWPMQDWLAALSEGGWIRWSADRASLEILRAPTAQEIDAAVRRAPVPRSPQRAAVHAA